MLLIYIIKMYLASMLTSLLFEKNENKFCPGHVAQLVGALSRTPKVCGFHSQAGHIPRLQVDPWVRCTWEATD